MPFLARQIKQARWLSAIESFDRGGSDIYPDCLGDLATKESAISLWLVEDDQSNLDEIVCALAACREAVDSLDLLLLPSSIPTSIGTVSVSVENSPYPEAYNNWHRNLGDLSGQRLIQLARYIVSGDQHPKRIKKDRVGEILLSRFQAGKLKVDLLNKKLRGQLEGLAKNNT